MALEGAAALIQRREGGDFAASCAAGWVGNLRLLGRRGLTARSAVTPAGAVLVGARQRVRAVVLHALEEPRLARRLLVLLGRRVRACAMSPSTSTVEICGHVHDEQRGRTRGARERQRDAVERDDRPLEAEARDEEVQPERRAAERELEVQEEHHRRRGTGPGRSAPRTGRTSGTATRMALKPSISMPRTSRKMFITMRNCQVLSSAELEHVSRTQSGMCSIDDVVHERVRHREDEDDRAGERPSTALRDARRSFLRSRSL